LFAGEAFEEALPFSAEASEYTNRKAPDNELLRTRARRMYAFTLRAAGRPEESIAQLVALNAGTVPEDSSTHTLRPWLPPVF